MAKPFSFNARRINKQLSKFESNIQKKITRQGLRAGAKVIAKEAKLRAPVDSGLLKSLIKVWAMKRSRKRIGMLVGTSAKDYTGEAFYGAFVEYGTEDMEANPWLKPAIEAKGNEARLAVEKKIIDGIAKEIAKLKGV